MKITITKPVEIDVKYIRVEAPVKYDEEDIPNNFPFRDGDQWNVLIDLETGKICNWPDKYEYGLHMKVTDGGIYELLDSDFMPVAPELEDYVPHGVIPGSYGDYIELTIEGDGTISNWPKELDLSVFFQDE